MEVVIQEKVPIVFTSAGNPKLWTDRLHENGIKVAHVVSSSKFALKAQQAGVDAVVAEGFEAGGHNGREETTTMVLIPSVKEVLDIPLIAAGGIATGGAMLACFALGAEGVQVGSRFAVSYESSASLEFKTLCTTLNEGDTMLSLKKISPTRLVRNRLFEQIDNAEQAGASKEELQEILGRGKAQQGIFYGDLENGELEIGQVSSIIRDIPTVSEIVERMVSEFEQGISQLRSLV
jgi:enoyl-[acyl-carrier protein] reductase II